MKFKNLSIISILAFGVGIAAKIIEVVKDEKDKEEIKAELKEEIIKELKEEGA